jgi:hypothetical protein
MNPVTAEAAPLPSFVIGGEMDDLKNIHWSELKKMMEEKGRRYTGKEQAIAFLSGAEARIETIPVIPDLISASTRLDRSRPFGQVIGSPTVYYTQDGYDFDSNEDKIDG